MKKEKSPSEQLPDIEKRVFKDFFHIQTTKSEQFGKDKVFSPWEWCELKEIKKLRENQPKNKDIYRSVFQYKEKEITSDKAGDLHLDFDAINLDEAKKDAIRILENFKEFYNISPASCEIVFSGKKGIGIVIPKEIFLTCPIPNPHLHYRAIIGFFKSISPTLDFAPAKTRAMWRITNSIHRGSGLYRIQLTFEELVTLSMEEIKELATSPRWVKRTPPVFSKELAGLLQKVMKDKKGFIEVKLSRPGDGDYSSLSPEQRIPKKYRHPVTMGGRHFVYCQLIGTLKTAGASNDEVRGIVKAFNKSYCRPPKSEYEVSKPLDYFLGKGGSKK